MRTAGEESSYSTSRPNKSFYLVCLSEAPHPEITLRVPNASHASLPCGIHFKQETQSLLLLIVGELLCLMKQFGVDLLVKGTILFSRSGS